ncbi:MAG: radical SAM protein, partial [Gammaproteobacteria bacterium]|nr:radical SAM protein [Gammaproteobacteria bacterium]
VARGPSRSLPPTLVRRQVERLIENGYREIVLCGVDLGAYGADFGSRYGLVELLVELVALPGEFRIRMSSVDPVHLDTNLVALLANERRLCPHIHLSMQSGNTLILKRMKRRYTSETLYERIGELRAALPQLVLSADVMVGFPTETDAQFADTLNALRDLQIAFPHVFSYSERPGTPAARIPKQVPVPVRKDRAAQTRALGAQIRNQLCLSRIGTCAQALIESDKGVPPGYRRGRCADYLPVAIPAGDAPLGAFVDVTITGQCGAQLLARRSDSHSDHDPATRQNSVDRPQPRR